MKFLPLRLFALVLATLAVPAFAQSSYPTATTVAPKAAGAVVLQCDSGVTACVPVTSSNPLQVSGTITSSGTVTGNVASGAADSGNPVKVGCKYNSTLPTVTDGQRVDAQCGTRGSLGVTLFTQDTNVAAQFFNDNSNTIGTSATSNKLMVLSRGTVFNGSWNFTPGDTNAVSVSTAGLSSTYWYYTSGTSPILSNTTTAVTIKAASGASVRSYIDACQIASTALGASVPLAIRDGAAGTVIWAMRPPTAGWTNPIYVNFSPPLRSTANTLLEVVTTTADTSGTFDVNCQGHTGT